MPPRARRIDANQRELIKVFERLGYSVVDTSAVGEGYPDLNVGKGGYTWLVEVKSKVGTLTPDQIKFRASWRGNYVLVRDVDDVLAQFGRASSGRTPGT